MYWELNWNYIERTKVESITPWGKFPIEFQTLWAFEFQCSELYVQGIECSSVAKETKQHWTGPDGEKNRTNVSSCDSNPVIWKQKEHDY